MKPPTDIFVRWKTTGLHRPIGWNPDLNDGVRLNIRPFYDRPRPQETRPRQSSRNAHSSTGNKHSGNDGRIHPLVHNHSNSRANKASTAFQPEPCKPNEAARRDDHNKTTTARYTCLRLPVHENNCLLKKKEFYEYETHQFIDQRLAFGSWIRSEKAQLTSSTLKTMKNSSRSHCLSLRDNAARSGALREF